MKQDVKIIPNFVDHMYYKEMCQVIQSAEFSWYYNDNISLYNTAGGKGTYGYSHWFFKPEDPPVGPPGWTQSAFTPFFKPFFLKVQSFLKAKKILRARGDMVTRIGNKEHVLAPHKDFNFDNIAAILVMNETDGDTIWYKDLKGKKEIKRKPPEPNTLILFPGNMWHTGCLPIKHNRRILLNSNYLL